MSSIFGKNIQISVFGESHGPAVGVTIHGLSSGIKINLEDLKSLMTDRMGVGIPGTTPRKEKEKFYFFSGVKYTSRNKSNTNNQDIIEDGYQSFLYTNGAPLTAVIYNMNVKTETYVENYFVPRPGHADYTQVVKWGEFVELSGGGHLSGRLTAPIVIAGGICLQILEKKGVFIKTELEYLGNNKITPGLVYGSNEFNTEISRATKEASKSNDSIGGIIRCEILGVPPGVGEPIFHKIESHLGQLIFSIPGIKGLEFGDGFESAKRFGSENNDSFIIKNGKILTTTNKCGGILGGISTGDIIWFRAAVKPTPSIGKPQKTIDIRTKKAVLLQTEGRHDVAVAIRTVPVVRAAAALGIYDLLLEYKEK
ncbi:chorismate synthase [Eubacteriales bacterium KG127]